MNDKYRIKELCRERGIRMGELARRVGYAQASSLSQALDKGIPSNRLIDIANVLNVSVPELFVSHQQSITCPHCGKQITIKTEEQTMAQKKYFRYHRGGFKESMKTMVEVNGLDDIRRIVEDDALIKGYYKNIRIGDGLVGHRCVPYGWGDTSYYVLADFGGYTGQCIGMANFKDD